MSHWIIAPVVIPAVLGALAVLVARFDIVLQRVIGLVGVLALTAVSILLVRAATVTGPEAYFLGDWPAPFGIVLVLDRLSALMLLLTAALALPVLLYVMGTGWDRRGQHFHALFLFQLMGLNGAFLTGDAFNLFVFFEVLLIASYGLMIHGGGRDRLKAGVQYVAFNLVGSTLFLFALATIYSVTGTLNLADLAQKVAILPEGDAALIRVGAVMLLLVFAIKGALVPVQFWLPGTYANAPGPVAALFAVMTKVGAYAVLRVYTLVFPPVTPATGSMFGDLILPAGLITLILGAIGVLGARKLGRTVAFSAIASMGTLFIAVSAFSPAGSTAALYYLLHSTLATAAMFLITDLVLSRRGTGTLSEARPPIAQSGLIAALFFVGAIAMAGMPPLSGFLGKLLILDATREEMGLVWPVILGTSLLMVVGFAQAGSLLFWKATALSSDLHQIEVRLNALPFVAIGLLFTLLIGLTLFAGPVTGWLATTAAELYAPAPYIAANALPVGG